jgi:predicted DNA-binding transcriptional regulator AlpA
MNAKSRGVDLNQWSFDSFPRVRIDSRTELVIAVDIAKRLGMSPQRVYVLSTSPGFPKPLGMLGRSAVWRWSSVERWARETGRLPADNAAA